MANETRRVHWHYLGIFNGILLGSDERDNICFASDQAETLSTDSKYEYPNMKFRFLCKDEYIREKRTQRRYIVGRNAAFSRLRN